MVCGSGPSEASTEQDHTVDHVQDALDFAAEVGVAGGIDDVDPGVVPDDRGALGQDGDAALALEIVAVHRLVFDLLIFPEGAGLFQKCVDEGRFAMVDVRDDGDVAHLHWVSSP